MSSKYVLGQFVLRLMCPALKSGAVFESDIVLQRFQILIQLQ